MRTIKRKSNSRKGGAVAEAALCLPLILLIISATIELTTTIYLKESLTIAAYEGCRMAVSRGATDHKVRERVARVLEERRITMDGYTPAQAILISPNSENANMLEPIKVVVVGPTTGNTVSPFGFMRFITPPEMSATVVMRKEFTIEDLSEEVVGP